MYSWKPIYVELGQKLLAYRNEQGELLSWLRDMKSSGIPVIGLNDFKPKGTLISLVEIDPFTFFANFNRGIKYEHRFEILRVLKTKMGLSAEVPQDFDGVPVANSQKAWFFPYAFKREPTTVPLLWEFAADVIGRAPETLREDLFARALEIENVGLGKVTMGMFWLQPDRYLALERVNRAYLEDEYGLPVKDLKPKTLQSYFSLLNAVRKKAGDDLPAISYEAFTRGVMVDLEPDVVDRGFRHYLEGLAEQGGYRSIVELVDRIKAPEPGSSESEITNRTIHQKTLAELLSRSDFTAEELGAVTARLWALSASQDTIRREAFLKSNEAIVDIRALLDEGGNVPVAT